jgi:hypothetical protein
LTLEEEIELDRKNLFAQSSMFYNEQEEVKKSNINTSKVKINEVEKLQDNDINIKKGNHEGKLDKAKMQAFKVGKSLVHKLKEKPATNDRDDELINGKINNTSKLIKLGVASGTLALFLHPVVGAIAGIAGVMHNSKNTDNKERADVHARLVGDLRVVQEKLKDLKEKDSLTDDEKKEKYALISLENELQSKIVRISKQIKENQ